MKLYIDTCVYKDYFGLNDISPILAIKLFAKIKRNNHILIVSTRVFQEFSKYDDVVKVKEFLRNFKYELIRYDEKDKLDANNLSKTNYPDALHVVLAKKSEASFIITRNLKDFYPIIKDIDVKHPREAIQII